MLGHEWVYTLPSITNDNDITVTATIPSELADAVVFTSDSRTFLMKKESEEEIKGTFTFEVELTGGFIYSFTLEIVDVSEILATTTKITAINN